MSQAVYCASFSPSVLLQLEPERMIVGKKSVKSISKKSLGTIWLPRKVKLACLLVQRQFKQEVQLLGAKVNGRYIHVYGGIAAQNGTQKGPLYFGHFATGLLR